MTTIYGTLAKPAGFDPARRYPLLIDVYGGPQSQKVRQRYVPANPYCELGFLIAAIDNRGTIHVQQGTLKFDLFTGGTITNRGTVRVDAGAILNAPAGLPTNGGIVRGGGQITGAVTFAGTGNALRPGPDAAPGMLTVTGNLALNAGTTLFARLHGATAHDRLAVTGDAVRIVDYKTNRVPPRSLAEVPEAYVLQLALYRALLLPLYPGKAVEAALLFTETPRLIALPADVMEAALARLNEA